MAVRLRSIGLFEGWVHRRHRSSKGKREQYKKRKESKKILLWKVGKAREKLKNEKRKINKLIKKSMLNKCFLLGNLTKDVELRTTVGGQTVGVVGLATSEKYKDKEGNLKESVAFHNLVVWGEGAKTLAKYVGKGDKLLVEGKINYRNYEDKNGNKRYITEILVRDFKFVGTKKKEDKPQASSQEDNGEIPVEELPF
jgi:single-strand DNA-binding protein